VKAGAVAAALAAGATAVLLGTAALSTDPAASSTSTSPTVHCGPPADPSVATDGTFTVVLNCQGPAPAAPTTAPPTPTPSATPTTVPTTAPPTTTPPPTTAPPTPSPGLNGCQTRLAACGLPDATSAGVPAGTKLTPIAGGLTVTQPGAVIDGQDISGCVEVRAPNVTIQNSRIIGAGCFYAVRNFSTGLQLLHDTITCGGYNGTGVSDNEFALVASDVSACENGANVSKPGNVTIQDSYIHDLVTANGAHTDGVQIGQAAAHLRFLHNTIINSGGQTSAIIMWDEGDPQNSDVIVDRNLLAGGSYTLYCPRSNTTGIQITGNRFGTGASYGPSNGCTSGHVAVWSGNVSDNNGRALQPA